MPQPFLARNEGFLYTEGKDSAYISVYMNMKRDLLILGATIVIVGTFVGIGTAFSKDGWFRSAENTSGSIAAASVADFTERMRAKVVSEIGQPIEGFEPFMFQRVFPGLIAQDFDKVDALIGLYRYQNGQIMYDLGGEQELHSAARAISDEGMLTLLVNIAERNGINLEGDGTIDDVLSAISESPGVDPAGGIEETQFFVIKGGIICLPHKVRGEFETMECAFGLKGDDGKNYGLENAFDHGILDTNEHVTVTGNLKAADPNFNYDVVGIIEIVQVEKR